MSKHKRLIKAKKSALLFLPIIGVIIAITRNPYIVLATSFLVSIILDPIVINLFSKTWDGSFAIRLTNFVIAFVLGCVIWVFVWIGTKHAEPIFYAPAWGVLFLLFSVVVPAIMNNQLKDITPSMWLFLIGGIVSFSAFLVLAAKSGF